MRASGEPNPRRPIGDEICTIGIDLGGTKIAAGLVSFPSAKILARETIPTLPARGGEAVLNDTVGVARRLQNHAANLGVRVQGIGVGIAELVNLQGEITSDYLILWRKLPARETLSQIAPTRFESDARAPALAEALFGAGRSFKHFVYVTVGTGISYCLVVEGQPYAGANGHAIIVGSGVLTSECEKCGTVQDQVLEEFAAGPSLVARYNHRVATPVTSGQEVVAAAAAGDGIAEQILRSAGSALGNSVGFLINVLDPAAVIVGGGLGLAGGLYWESFVDSTRRHVWSAVSKTLPIVKAELGSEAGLIGAAAVVWKRGP
ncbi:MAG: ROK family protein [Acidobacteriia bacterium]|nr:ROK family protein [Terriglobia bacterium]